MGQAATPNQGQQQNPSQSSSGGSGGGGSNSFYTEGPQYQQGSMPTGNSNFPDYTQLSNTFLHPNFTAPYYNLVGVAGNVGTAAGSALPGATNFLNQLFNPQLNQMEQTFLQSGTDSALRAQEQAMTRAEQQFENTPFHSGLNQARQDVVNDTTRNLAQSASQAGLQRQQLATSAVQFPFEMPLNAANTGAQASERMFNIANQAYAAPWQIPLSVYSQLPITAPTIATNSGGGGGKGIV